MFDFWHGFIWKALFALISGYLMGSLPWGVIISRIFGGPDPRTVGSGHTGATNVFLNTGQVAGILTGLMDFGKGALAVWLVQQIFPDPWLVPITGVAVIIGHCWPAFADFKGGMGVATAAGLALWQFPVILPIFAAAYFLVNYFVKHQARTMMLISAFIPLMVLPFHLSAPKMALASGIAIVLVIRWASDFNRTYD